MAWPPTLDELKDDLKITDDRDDERLTRVLDASVFFVERVRARDYNFGGGSTSTKPDPAGDASLILGTIRLAGRWHARNRSPDGLVMMAEAGSGRVPSVDPDIDRLLRIGRHARPVVG
ncbi:hypothetical protein [Jiangella asiatica]|uniref:Phage gp6-like head-tail connector protein n=1 Tax=Jiangella asiatica TaxID=2530372 RepID=A0A4R5CJW4_9ACTN|nr:hypothetical protein [Jiangella asiatica]TDD98900.1 hypothetical protein E1269_28255 [Jiangella asiatica]